MLREKNEVEMKIERLDHLGIISQTIKDLGIIELIDQRIPTDDQEHISTGEAVAGMILNGLGFSNRPLSLTPQFFENKPLDIMFRAGVKAEHFNRFKLGRSLEDLHQCGCSLLFSEIALAVCEQEQIDMRFNHLDTTSVSVSGQYESEEEEREEATISLKRGYSKDHRPDLKQAVLEMIVSQDGGLPLVSQAWDGNRNDSPIFNERSQELVKQLSRGETPRYLIADSKLYSLDNSPNLAQLGYITRIPNTLNITQQVIKQAWEVNEWQTTPDQYHYQCWQLGHYGIDQRWLVVYSEASRQRAEKTVDRAIERERTQLDKDLFHLQAQRFASVEEAEQTLTQLGDKLTYHRLSTSALISHHRYAQAGRPKTDTVPTKTLWQIQGHVLLAPEQRRVAIDHKACYIIGSNICADQLSELELLTHYRQQNQVERGFRFLKDPSFFTSALFVKKTTRLQALLMVMTLALLVYAVAERRLRRKLQAQKETIPNQINQPTDRPTLRWVFQLLDGIHRVHLFINGQWSTIIDGITDLRRRILSFFGPDVCRLYQIFLS